MVRRLIPYCISLILLVIIVSQCKSGFREKEMYNSNLTALTDTVSYYKNRLGNQTATIKTLELQKEQLDKVIIQKDKQLKTLTAEFSSVNSVIKYSTQTKIDTLVTVFKNPVDSLPRFSITGNRFDKWFSFKYKVTNDSLILSPFITHTGAAIVTGYKRKWFLGKETLTTDITFSNPYIEVNQLSSAQVNIRQPLYRKWYVWLGIGIVGGLLLK
ncbi:hypothetical protein FUA48_10980 [Flavobacterium alkalisoli]|uniref:Uncharacterized protein n=1 Tax=Flavobacterium alkalisoli TaxID=2602769 RepID=A0A5B9FRT9_9FLAO|nr:DUF6549 family protein [Flavobacterium alkalisoli]QEE50083.1 hypothetical protein FUA48_10980 [Flavobacterium alkalisoli]